MDDLLRILVSMQNLGREPVTAGDGRGSVLAVIDIKGEDLRRSSGGAGMLGGAGTWWAWFWAESIRAGRSPSMGALQAPQRERIVTMAKRMGDRVRQEGNPSLEPCRLPSAA